MKVIIAAVLVLACVCWSGADDSCTRKFRQDPKWDKASDVCFEKAGLSLGEMPDFQKDDKCYTRCLYSEVGMLKGLKFDLDAIKADILENILDKDYKTKVTAYTMDCLKKAEESLGKITDANVCKVSAQVSYCISKEEQNLPCHL